MCKPRTKEGDTMTSIELCNEINSYLLSKDCTAVDYIFSTFVTDEYKEVVSKIIIKFFEDTIVTKMLDASILEDTEIAEKILLIATDNVKMRYLCSSIIDATAELERSKASLLLTAQAGVLNIKSTEDDDNKDNQLPLSTIVIGGLVISSIFVYIFCVTFFADFIKSDNVRFVDQTLGNFNAILQTLIVFFFSGDLRVRLLRGKQKSTKEIDNKDNSTREDNNMNNISRNLNDK
jgi:hypothetical protein